MVSHDHLHACIFLLIKMVCDIFNEVWTLAKIKAESSKIINMENLNQRG
jgi:hypothetical protein